MHAFAIIRIRSVLFPNQLYNIFTVRKFITNANPCIFIGLFPIIHGKRAIQKRFKRSGWLSVPHLIMIPSNASRVQFSVWEGKKKFPSRIQSLKGYLCSSRWFYDCAHTANTKWIQWTKTKRETAHGDVRGKPSQGTGETKKAK